ncbi:hypothetical protein HPSA50_1752 [Helicobacter pylori SouthAfrica50]|uniref:Uncharacterized protein n=1 Tax=Helicobacter pylori SouthAfrica50 TaxID=1352357 RepID=T2S9N0_HELPX|nr:hypothetical protein HPSA50_1752 [Helicobacter pylori SouthAfrica50]
MQQESSLLFVRKLYFSLLVSLNFIVGRDKFSLNHFFFPNSSFEKVSFYP